MDPPVNSRIRDVFHKATFTNSFVDFFFLLRKGRKELVWLCFGFLCAIASLNLQMQLGLSVKLIGSCGKRCVWRNVDHTCEKTQGLSNTVPMSPRIECFPLPEMITWIFFPCIKTFPTCFPLTLLKWPGIKIREPCSSVYPSALPVLNDFVLPPHVLMLCWKTLFSHVPFK